MGAGDGDTNTNWDTGGVDTGGTAAVWDKNHVGGEKFLVVLDSGAQLCFPGEYSIGTDAGAYKVAIQRHFAEDKLRRVTVRNAMALAEALGRTLVLPKARCYCDKIWNNLNACRAPGTHFPLTTFRRLIVHTRTRRDYYDQKGLFPRTVTLTVYSYQSLIHVTID